MSVKYGTRISPRGIQQQHFNTTEYRVDRLLLLLLQNTEDRASVLPISIQYINLGNSSLPPFPAIMFHSVRQTILPEPPQFPFLKYWKNTQNNQACPLLIPSPFLSVLTGICRSSSSAGTEYLLPRAPSPSCSFSPSSRSASLAAFFHTLPQS